jgi:PBP1b-binding outer membrane lipoprotein LpoB
VTPTLRRTTALLAAVLLAAGCSSSQDTAEESAAPESSTISPSDLPDLQAPPDRTTIDISIENGTVTPTNEQVQAKVNEPIVLRVNSDAADELHVHSTPEHTFTVEPNNGQQFQFTVDVPGRVDIELHELGQVVATVEVQP